MAAVPEGVGESLNAGCSRVGGDSRCSKGVDAALDQDLSDIQAGGLESGDQTEVQGACYELPVSADVIPAAEQSRIGIPQIEKAADRGERLRQDRGRCCAAGSKAQNADKEKVQGNVRCDSGCEESQGRPRVADGPQDPGKKGYRGR